MLNLVSSLSVTLFGRSVPEMEVHRWLCLGLMGLGVITFVGLHFAIAAYGRHRGQRTKWCLSNRAGWLGMEIPTVLLFPAIVLSGRHADALAVWVMSGLWLLHYGYRTLLYPMRLPYARHRFPVEVVATGFSFQMLNSYLNARWISELHLYPRSWLGDWRFLLGSALFLAALAGNFWSDEILLRLKRASPDKYQIPRGGMFRWVSSPNYMFEILEWGGWALLTWSISGAAFFVYTVANLAPRAMTHHRWYLERFEDYPPQRRALIPKLW